MTNPRVMNETEYIPYRELALAKIGRHVKDLRKRVAQRRRTGAVLGKHSNEYAAREHAAREFLQRRIGRAWILVWRGGNIYQQNTATVQ